MWKKVLRIIYMLYFVQRQDSGKCKVNEAVAGTELFKVIKYYELICLNFLKKFRKMIKQIGLVLRKQKITYFK